MVRSPKTQKGSSTLGFHFLDKISMEPFFYDALKKRIWTNFQKDSSDIAK